MDQQVAGDSRLGAAALPHAPSTWPALWLLCFAFFVDVMGSTSVFAAAPSIQRSLHLTQTGLQWSVIAATLPGGALLLAGGRLADLFGRRRMFAVGLVMLLCASLGCGLASSSAVLIAFRVVLGVGGALLLPAALSLLTGIFVEPDARNPALGAWSAIGGIGATAGLLLGGAVTAGLGWRWVFLVNVPVLLAMLALCPVLLSEPPLVEPSRRVDVAGIVLFCTGLALVMYGLGELPDIGWRDPRTLGAAVLGAGLLTAFARQEALTDDAIVPAALLRSAQVRAGNFTLIIAGMCVDGLLLTLTLYTQGVKGFSPLGFGAVTAVMTVASVAAASLAQRALPRLGTRRLSILGLSLLVVTGVTFVIAVGAGGSLVILIGGMVTFGLGMGGAFVAGSVASLQDVAHKESGVAAAVQNISFGLGTTVGVAVLSTVIAGSSDSRGRVVGGHALIGATQAAFAAAAAIALVGVLVTRSASSATTT